MKFKNSDHKGVFISDIFKCVKVKYFRFKSKPYSKYSGIRIGKNILRINYLFFYENRKFRPRGGPFEFISYFFEGVKVEFFRFISKQIAYLVSLNTPRSAGPRSLETSALVDKEIRDK